MKIRIKVKTNSRETKVAVSSDGQYIVSVKEPPNQGKANEAVINVIAKHFGVAKNRLKIISGRTAKQKVVEIK